MSSEDKFVRPADPMDLSSSIVLDVSYDTDQQYNTPSIDNTDKEAPQEKCEADFDHDSLFQLPEHTSSMQEVTGRVIFKVHTKLLAPWNSYLLKAIMAVFRWVLMHYKSGPPTESVDTDSADTDFFVAVLRCFSYGYDLLLTALVQTKGEKSNGAKAADEPERVLFERQRDVWPDLVFGENSMWTKYLTEAPWSFADICGADFENWMEGCRQCDKENGFGIPSPSNRSMQLEHSSDEDLHCQSSSSGSSEESPIGSEKNQLPTTTSELDSNAFVEGNLCVDISDEGASSSAKSSADCDDSAHEFDWKWDKKSDPLLDITLQQPSNSTKLAGHADREYNMADELKSDSGGNVVSIEMLDEQLNHDEFSDDADQEDNAPMENRNKCGDQLTDDGPSVPYCIWDFGDEAREQNGDKGRLVFKSHSETFDGWNVHIKDVLMILFFWVLRYFTTNPTVSFSEMDRHAELYVALERLPGLPELTKKYLLKYLSMVLGMRSNVGPERGIHVQLDRFTPCPAGPGENEFWSDFMNHGPMSRMVLPPADFGLEDLRDEYVFDFSPKLKQQSTGKPARNSARKSIRKSNRAVGGGLIPRNGARNAVRKSAPAVGGGLIARPSRNKKPVDNISNRKCGRKSAPATGGCRRPRTCAKDMAMDDSDSEKEEVKERGVLPSNTNEMLKDYSCVIDSDEDVLEKEYPI